MSLLCPDGHVSASEDYCDVCGLPITAADGAGEGAQAAQAWPTPTSVPAQAGPSPLTQPAPLAEKQCPNCGATAPADALFCEDCGYDFTTGALPEPADAGPDDPAAAAGPGPDVTPAPAAEAASPGPSAAAPAPPVAAAAAPAPDGAAADPSAPLAAANIRWVAEIWVDPDWYATQDSDDPCPSSGTPVEVTLNATSVLVGRRSVSRNIHPQIDCGTDSGVSRRHAQISTDGQRWWVEDLQSANGTYLGSPTDPLPTEPIEPGQRTQLGSADRIYLGAWTRIVIRPTAPGGP